MSGVDNPPAFPLSWVEENEHGVAFREMRPGMSLRDWFAGQALAGLMATNADFHDERGDGWDWHARAAYSLADAMLAARGRPTDNAATTNQLAEALAALRDALLFVELVALRAKLEGDLDQKSKAEDSADTIRALLAKIGG